jgi:hypothetical protein
LWPNPASAFEALSREARSQLEALHACFDAFSGENQLRVAGLPLVGLGFLGSDLPLRRRWFDRRLRTGLFRPARRGVVTPTELAGLLKPPSARCGAANVARSGGVVAPPPPGLATFAGEEKLIPLGRVRERDGERRVGVPVAETFFAYMAGRSRYGKTETAIGQFVHLVRQGHGGLFLDPHADAIAEIKAYLTDAGVRERVVEINLADHRAEAAQPGTRSRSRGARRTRPPAAPRRSSTRWRRRSAGTSATRAPST